MAETSAQERFKRGAADAGGFFRYVAAFIGFTEEQAATIRETRFIIEKHIPSIVAAFYAQLLRFPATRQHFLRKDGSLDRPYLELRMQHQASFWRRAASGNYGEDFARYVDYVGRAHTSQGADPRIYIPERYVIGMVGFMQQRISEALESELRDMDPELERRATKAWSALLMVVLELLSRSYRAPQQGEAPMAPQEEIDDEAMMRLSVETYERALGMARSIAYRVQRVALPGEIGEGQRKIVQVDDLSIGVFRHKGQWVALHNSCLHRGGPVCTGKLEGDTLTCPWHGYQYELPGGKLLLDADASLPRYEVEEREDGLYVRVPILIRDEVDTSLGELESPAPMPAAQPAPLPGAPVAAGVAEAPAAEAAVLPPVEFASLPLAENQFAVAHLAPGQIGVVSVDGEPVAVYNVEGRFYATHEACTHAGGPLSQGDLDGHLIICPWHDSCFDVRSGEVRCGPAVEAVRSYVVTVADGVGTVATM